MYLSTRLNDDKKTCRGKVRKNNVLSQISPGFQKQMRMRFLFFLVFFFFFLQLVEIIVICTICLYSKERSGELAEEMDTRLMSDRADRDNLHFDFSYL